MPNPLTQTSTMSPVLFPAPFMSNELVTVLKVRT